MDLLTFRLEPMEVTTRWKSGTLDFGMISELRNGIRKRKLAEKGSESTSQCISWSASKCQACLVTMLSR
eukprot:1659333-Amphidinium_carterae.2